jgi:membrane protein
MIMLHGSFLIISLVADSVIALCINRLSASMRDIVILVSYTSSFVSMLYIFILFTVMYKYLPRASVSWKAALSGGAIGSILFMIGRYLLGLYIATNTIATIYGVAGAIVLILLWFYYSAQIFFFGASVTYAVDQNRNLRQTSL